MMCMKCRLCGENAIEFECGHTIYAKCPVCSYIGIDPERMPCPRAEEARYRLHNNDYEDTRYRAWIAEFLDAVSDYLPPGGRVLDFGSGPEPVPARILSERGCIVTSYDPYFAPDTDWRRPGWDAILVHEVAEHLNSPGDVFSELSGLLSPGGALCIRTRFPPSDREAFRLWRYRMDETHVGFLGHDCFSWIARNFSLDVAMLTPPDRAVLVKSELTRSSLLDAQASDVYRRLCRRVCSDNHLGLAYSYA